MADPVTQGEGAANLDGGDLDAGRDAMDDLPDDILDMLDGGADPVDEDGAATSDGTGEGADKTQTPATGVKTTTTAQPQSTTATTTTAIAGETPEAKAAREEAERKAAEEAAKPIVETPEVKAAREAAEKDTNDKWIATLETFYEIPEDQRNDLLVNPEKALPKLAAKMHAQVFKDATQASLRLVAAAIPGFIKMHMEGGTRETEAKTEFFTRYPTLNKPEYFDKILAAGRTFKQLRPDADPDETMENMALFASKALRIDHVPYVPSQTQKPQQKQPKPAGAGGGSSQSVAKPKGNGDNPWSEMVDDD